MNITSIAAGTTIVVNLLEIKSNIHRIKVAVHGTKLAGKKAGKTVKKVITK